MLMTITDGVARKISTGGAKRGSLQ